MIGRFYYDDQGFRVRQRRAPGGGRRGAQDVKLLNPSMYFSVETVKELDGTPWATPASA